VPLSTPTWRPHPAVLRVAVYAFCFLVIGAAVWLVVQVLSLLGLALFPVVVATFLTRVLSVPSGWLRRRGWRPAPSAAVVLVGFLVLVGLVIALIAPPMVREFSNLGSTVEDGVAEIEDWLVEDSPFDVTRRDVEDAKDDASRRARRVLRDSEGEVAAGARLALSGLVGLVLALIFTFFAVKDGPRFQRWALGLLPEQRRDDAVAVARASWASLGGYLRGAALLGVVEAFIIGGTMLVAGGSLILPVMLLTFVAAFVPLVGASVAGTIAVLVTLATGGLVNALAVGVVVILVQQFDNDLLAPWIYGKALSMHPAVILLSIATGTALFGFVGTVLAVPLTAVVINSVTALRGPPLDDGDGDARSSSMAPTGGAG